MSQCGRLALLGRLDDIAHVIQRSLFENKSKFSSARVAHGGDLSRGRAKHFRPLDRKRPLHIVLKSTHAKGRYSLLREKLAIAELVRVWAKKCDVVIHEFQNVGNHLHLLVSFKVRLGLQTFLRVVSGRIARLVTRAERGRPFGRRFWDHLVFTRIVTGRRDFQAMLRYIFKNRMEAEAGGRVRDALEQTDVLKREARKRKVPVHDLAKEWLASQA